MRGFSRHSCEGRCAGRAPKRDDNLGNERSTSSEARTSRARAPEADAPAAAEGSLRKNSCARLKFPEFRAKTPKIIVLGSACVGSASAGSGDARTGFSLRGSQITAGERALTCSRPRGKHKTRSFECERLDARSAPESTAHAPPLIKWRGRAFSRPVVLSPATNMSASRLWRSRILQSIH